MQIPHQAGYLFPEKLHFQFQISRFLRSLPQLPFQKLVGIKNNRANKSIFDDMPASAGHVIGFHVGIAAAGVRAGLVDAALVLLEERTGSLLEDQIAFVIFFQILLPKIKGLELEVI